MQVLQSPRARAEYVEVLAWYLEHGGIELAERFQAELARILAGIEDNPRRWAEYEPGVRRVLLTDFPYALHYVIRSDHIFVLALAHQRRRPGYWRSRIPK